MPQVEVHGPDGNIYQFPDGTTKEQAVAYFKKKGVGVNQSIAAVDSNKAPTFREKYVAPTVAAIRALLPSPRDAAGMAGAAIGGAVSAPAYVTGPGGIAATAIGGGAGYVGGTNLYDAFEQLRTGTPKTDSTPVADFATGALQEAGGKYLAEKTAGAIERSIPKSVERAISPAGIKEKLAIREASPVLSKNLPFAATEGSLNDKVAQRVGQLTTQLESEWSKLPATMQIPTAPVRVGLQQERSKLFNANGSLVQGAGQLESELSGMIDYLGKNPTLSPTDFRNNRQLWDKFVKWYRPDTVGASVAPEREQVYEMAADKFRDVINRAFPHIQKINEQLSAYIPASQVLDRRELSQVGTPLSLSLRGVIPELAGAGAGAVGGWLMGNPAEGAAIGSGIVALRQIMNTTAWNTASIPIKRAVVDLLNRGAVQEAIGVLMGEGTQKLRQGPLVISFTSTPVKTAGEAKDLLAQPSR